MKRLKLGIICLMSLFLWNCSDDKKAEDPCADKGADTTFTTLYTNVFSQDCQSCHMPGGQAYDVDGVQLDFSSQATAHNTLSSLNVTGATSVGTCNGVEIVASSATDSYIAAVLYSDYATSGFGGVQSCVPYSAHREDSNLSCLASQYKSSLIGWINGGAPNN